MPTINTFQDPRWQAVADYASVLQYQRLQEELAREEEVTLVVQVNGKVRERLQVPADIGEEQAKELALASQRVRAHIDNKQIQRVIYVPGKLVNVVVR